MFDLREYYREKNDRVRPSYENSLLTIREIENETGDYHKADGMKEYYRFLSNTAKFIMRMADYERNIDDDYFSMKTFEELLNENGGFYDEIAPENYENNYTNPTYCVSVFGEKFGQLMSYFYSAYRQYIRYAVYHKIFKMEEYNRVFIEVFNSVKHRGPEYETLREVITRPQRELTSEEMILSVKEQYDRDFGYLRDIVENSDLTDLRYLFKYGKPITDNEVKTARFLMTYPEEKIKKLSNQIVKSYLNGFIRDNKDISKKTTVGVIFSIGRERIIRQLIDDLKKHNLETLMSGVWFTKVNKQYDCDHKFDAALYLDEKFTILLEKNYEEAGENCRETMSVCSGTIYVMKFGDLPFVPENKRECLRFTDEQQTLFQIHQGNMMRITDKYYPRKEWSFTIVAFPSPEIGGNFRQIFEDISRVNMLNTEEYETIQQKIIDVLDQGDCIHVKGKGSNETDISVKMQEIKNPARETNFLNSGAGVNIPVGEVFTSPRLSGTNGILHVDETYLAGLRFIDLKLVFKDGYAVECDCANYDKAEDNKKYCDENLLFPHKTLPIGEFAIGTNTLAYVITRKHNIANVLPALITEKMGPHFAIGDTCFAFREDIPVFNRLDNKEITARENEKTALRKTNMNGAYTNKHTDITLPYESIEFVTVVRKNGERIDVIRDGRFVLEGTEELNKAFET